MPPKNYNQNIRPNYGKQPVKVTIGLKINDISSISETSLDFQVDFSIRHFWNDHRLQFEVKNNISEIPLEEQFTQKIWLPGTFFKDSKKFKVLKTVFTEGTTLIRVSSNEDILYSTEMSFLATCSMNLKYFPVDQQKCSLVFGNCKY